jgi:hypothetical protein
MGVQRQHERWAFLHDTPPRMPVPVARSLVPFGLPNPTLPIHVVLAAWPRVSTDAEACGTAGHHPRHVGVKWRGVTCQLLLPGRAWSLARRGRPVRPGPRGRDALDLLPVLTDDWGFCLHSGPAAVETSGPALEWGVRAAATVGLQGALERRTDVSPGFRHASVGRLERPPLIGMAYATHGAPVIQYDLASSRRRVGRGADVLGHRVRRWWRRRGRRGRGNGGGRAGAAAPWRQHRACNGTQPAYCAAPRDLGVPIRLPPGLGHVAQQMMNAIPMRAPGQRGRDPCDERLVFV